jgi:hypothetical protein
VVAPWPLPSKLRIPALGRRDLMDLARRAKESPLEPAPWWVTKRGPGLLGEKIGEVR